LNQKSCCLREIRSSGEASVELISGEGTRRRSNDPSRSDFTHLTRPRASLPAMDLKPRLASKSVIMPLFEEDRIRCQRSFPWALGNAAPTFPSAEARLLHFDRNGIVVSLPTVGRRYDSDPMLALRQIPEGAVETGLFHSIKIHVAFRVV